MEGLAIFCDGRARRKGSPAPCTFECLVLNVLERSGFPDGTWPFHVRRSAMIYILSCRD